MTKKGKSSGKFYRPPIRLQVVFRKKKLSAGDKEKAKRIAQLFGRLLGSH